METDQTTHKQMINFNTKAMLPDQQINWLVTTWAFPFRLFIYPFIRPEIFNCLYSSVESKPEASQRITAALMLIQKILNKTDGEMYAWAMGGDIAVRFATDTLRCSVDKLCDCAKDLSLFKMRCQDYANSHEEKNPLDECLRETGYGMCAMMGIDLSKIRINSNDISVNMGRLSRETLVYLANKRMVDYLAHQDNQEKKDEIEKAHLGHYLDRNDRNQVIFQSQKRKDSTQKILAEDADRILKICKAEDLESEDGKRYTRILSEQTVEKKGVHRFAPVKEGAATTSCFQASTDPEAAFRMKAGKEFIQYVTKFAEAIGNGARMDSSDFEQNVLADSVMAIAFLKEAREIVVGIEQDHKILGIEPLEELEKCLSVLDETLRLANERIPAERRAGKKIPRWIKTDPLDEQKKEEPQDPPYEGEQLTMDDLLG